MYALVRLSLSGNKVIFKSDRNNKTRMHLKLSLKFPPQSFFQLSSGHAAIFLVSLCCQNEWSLVRVLKHAHFCSVLRFYMQPLRAPHTQPAQEGHRAKTTPHSGDGQWRCVRHSERLHVELQYRARTRTLRRPPQDSIGPGSTERMGI